jgi:hypothetical protein
VRKTTDAHACGRRGNAVSKRGTNLDSQRDTDALWCRYVLTLLYAVRMPNRRLRRKLARAQRHTAPPTSRTTATPEPTNESFRAPPVAAAKREQPEVVIRQARYVERLAYTRTQAAEALGIGRSTFTQRVLPFIETVQTPWGKKLIPVDELERLTVEWRRPGRPRRRARAPGGRPAVPAEVSERIRAARDAGRSLREIAEQLNAEGTPTAQGGTRWWPSTVRWVLNH